MLGLQTDLLVPRQAWSTNRTRCSWWWV